MSGDSGAVYVVYGDSAYQEAQQSIESMKGLHPSLPITVVGDRPIDGVEHILRERRDRGGRWTKINLDSLSPYGLTLYIDADTRVHQPIQTGFEMLVDGWELVLTASTHQGSSWLWHVSGEEREATMQSTIIKALQLQAGLMFFRKCDAMHRLFERWRAEWRGGQDQGALLRALYQEPVRIWLLGRCWNGGAIVEHRFGAIRTKA